MADHRPAWLENWLQRHQSPLSLGLHLVGIPLVIAALVLAGYQLWLWRWDLWWRPALLLAAGYGLQILGHGHEGNDVGEWILIKWLLARSGPALSPRCAGRPKTVAVIGASADRSKFGNKAIRAYLRQGWVVYPVNPRGGRIEGRKVYAALEDIPAKLDRVALYVPPAAGIALLPAIARIDAPELFVNPGAESEELVSRAHELGLAPILACSILATGQDPADFPD